MLCYGSLINIYPSAHNDTIARFFPKPNALLKEVGHIRSSWPWWDRRNKTGVINDPLGQATVLADNESLFCFCKLGQTDV